MYLFSAIDGCGGVPPIRPLETLHNALSMKQLDGFLDSMTSSIQLKTPIPSPPKVPSTPTPQSKYCPCILSPKGNSLPIVHDVILQTLLMEVNTPWCKHHQICPDSE